jgi:hypothetical protein
MGLATPQGTAARGKSAGRGRGAIFTPQKIRGTPLKFSESRYFAQPLCPAVLEGKVAERISWAAQDNFF